jgi:hypothetical protein
LVLDGPDADVPAQARIAEAQGDPDRAIRLLRDVRDADALSTLLSVIISAKGDDNALAWIDEQHLLVPDLTANGVVVLCQIHLRRGALEPVKRILTDLTNDQIVACPYFYFMRGAIRFASVLPKPEQAVALSGLPLDVRRARPVLLDAEVAGELDSATADLQRALPLATDLELREAPRLIRAYLVWCAPGRMLDRTRARIERGKEPLLAPSCRFAIENKDARSLARARHRLIPKK